jgi:hypothetical protein
MCGRSKEFSKNTVLKLKEIMLYLSILLHQFNHMIKVKLSLYLTN